MWLIFALTLVGSIIGSFFSADSASGMFQELQTDSSAQHALLSSLDRQLPVEAQQACEGAAEGVTLEELHSALDLAARLLTPSDCLLLISAGIAKVAHLQAALQRQHPPPLAQQLQAMLQALPSEWQSVASSAPTPPAWVQTQSSSSQQLLVQQATTGQLHTISPHHQLLPALANPTGTARLRSDQPDSQPAWMTPSHASRLYWYHRQQQRDEQQQQQQRQSHQQQPQLPSERAAASDTIDVLVACGSHA